MIENRVGVQLKQSRFRWLFLARLECHVSSCYDTVLDVLYFNDFIECTVIYKQCTILIMQVTFTETCHWLSVGATLRCWLGKQQAACSSSSEMDHAFPLLQVRVQRKSEDSQSPPEKLMVLPSLLISTSRSTSITSGAALARYA